MPPTFDKGNYHRRVPIKHTIHKFSHFFLEQYNTPTSDRWCSTRSQPPNENGAASFAVDLFDHGLSNPLKLPPIVFVDHCSAYTRTIIWNTLVFPSLIKASLTLQPFYSEHMSMNPFRFCGDMSHLFSIIVLLLRLRVAKNAQGESGSQWCILWGVLKSLTLWSARSNMPLTSFPSFDQRIPMVCTFRHICENTRAVLGRICNSLPGFVYNVLFLVQLDNEDSVHSIDRLNYLHYLVSRTHQEYIRQESRFVFALEVCRGSLRHTSLFYSFDRIGHSRVQYSWAIVDLFDLFGSDSHSASVDCLTTLSRGRKPDGKLYFLHGRLPSLVHSELDLPRQHGEELSASLGGVYLWGYSDTSVRRLLLLLH